MRSRLRHQSRRSGLSIKPVLIFYLQASERPLTTCAISRVHYKQTPSENCIIGSSYNHPSDPATRSVTICIWPNRALTILHLLSYSSRLALLRQISPRILDCHVHSVSVSAPSSYSSRLPSSNWTTHRGFPCVALTTSPCCP